MKKYSNFLLVSVAFTYAGCAVSHSYYQSPLDVNVNSYHAVPLRSDSVKSAVYGSANFLAGESNYQGRDNLMGFQANIYQSHSLGLVNAFYGAGFSKGSYHVGEYYGTKSNNYDTTYHIAKSSQSFGAYGFNGGMSFALPGPRERGEFRIGFEAALYKEFGNYLSYRQSLPDSVADIIATSGWTKTIGGTMEFVSKHRRSGTIFSYKVAVGGSFVSADNYRGAQSADVPFYFSNTLQLTKHRVTGFAQLNFGKHQSSFQMGFAYRLTHVR
ncbi:MAG: hypothetical protein JST87_06830 [Bacteroidetes bacterium]|nr:hypothetical protein [Bacteroidota bacterium]